jgi:hypothetical protein
MSQFDTSTFLDFTTTEESVKRPPLPEGDYTAVIGDLTTREWVSPKDPTKSGIAVDVQLRIDVPGDVQEALGLTESTLKVKDGIMLDLTPQKTLDMSAGKNGKLRKYRDATNNNKAGQPFNIRMLSGQVITVKIGHREYPEGSGDFFEQPTGVAAHG